MASLLDLELFPPGPGLPGGEVQDSAHALVLSTRLAWALRQREGDHARQIAQSVLASADLEALDGPQGLWVRARMTLVLAELSLLDMHLDPARSLLQEAGALFETLQDWQGQADVQWLKHYEAADRGDGDALREALRSAILLAERACDDQRLLLLKMTLARSELFRDQAQANASWDHCLPRTTQGLRPACAAALADFRGLQCGLSADFAPAAQWLIEAFRLSMESGQLRRAMSVASNLGYTYTSMSDYPRAVEWLQQGLGLARQARWPGALSLALAQTGDAMRRIGQLSAARDLLLECQSLLIEHPHNRSALLALKYLAEVELDLEQNDRALENFTRLAECALCVDSKDLHTDAALGRARALLRAGRLDEARAAGLHAREVAQQQRERSTLVDVLWTLAKIDQAVGSSASELLTWTDAALSQAEALSGYRPPPALLEMAAALHAQTGDFSQAYVLSQRASELRQQVFTEESGKQAALLHVQHQVEKARAEQEHLRQLAQSEAERAAALQSLHSVLLRLGDCGKEITSQLSTERVLQLLQGHVRDLLQAEQLTVYLLDECGEQLCCAFGQSDVGDTPGPIAVADVEHECARVLSGRAVLLMGEGTQTEPGRGQCMVAPLQLADRELGVMRVVGTTPGCFGEHEQLIFRNLCAYTAVALDNARAYEQLGELQRQVAAQEKMASIGQLAAGVAHEINNPIGFVNSNLGSLARDVRDLLDLLQLYRQAGPLVEGGAGARAQALAQSMDLDYLSEDMPRMIAESIEGLQRVKRIVQDLKNFSRVDAAEWVYADLNECVESTLNMLTHEIKFKAVVHKGLARLPPVYCLAAQINQVLMNLLVNASQAIESAGQISIRSWQESDWACIAIRDNGCGMSEQVMARIFEPFFTTKPVGKGTGLGLSLSYSIVKKHRGRLEVESTPGQGSCFTLRLPLSGLEEAQQSS